MELSGLVAILNEQGAITEVRDLGPKPIAVKPGRVLPLVDMKPAEAAAHRPVSADQITIEKGRAVRQWVPAPVEEERDSIEDRLARIEAKLAEMGHKL